MTVIQLETTQKGGQTVSRHCDTCGKAFNSKNAAAAQAMLAQSNQNMGWFLSLLKS